MFWGNYGATYVILILCYTGVDDPNFDEQTLIPGKWDLFSFDPEMA